MKLEKNAKVCMRALPFWIVPYTFYMYYLSIYLLEKGITESQVSLLMTVSNISALVFSFFSSSVVDRMGRKNSLLVFDFLSSALPALLFLVSTNFYVVMFGMILTGLNRIMSTAYYLLMIEDTSDRNSMDAMNAFNIISVGAGVLTPLAGVVVTRLGVVSGERIFLLVSFVLMTVQAVIRHRFVSETPTGIRVRENKAVASSVDVSSFLKWIVRKPSAITAVMINSLVYVYYNVATTSSLLFTPYFSVYRGISGVSLSAVGGLYAVATLFTMIIINPRIKQEKIKGSMMLSSALSIIGMILLISVSSESIVLLFVSILVIGLSYGNLKSLSDAVLALECGEEYGSEIYSLSFILSAVFSVVAIQVVNLLYEYSPDWLFGFSAIIIALVMLLSATYKHQRSKNA